MKNKTNLTTGGGITNIVSKFLQGVVAYRYEIKLIRKYIKPDGSNGAYVIERNWSETEILKNIDFLIKKNTENFNIYIRPLDNQFVLLDDLSRDVLEELAKIKPCLLMETSLGNYQAWVKLVNIPENRSGLLNVWRLIAIQFNADMASAKPYQIGRLPGFYNMKSKYSPNFPFVKLHKFTNRLSIWKYDNNPPPVVKLSKHIQKGFAKDRSGFDFAVACTLIEKNWKDDRIMDYLMQRSQKAKERGKRYLSLTISNARKKIYG